MAYLDSARVGMGGGRRAESILNPRVTSSAALHTHWPARVCEARQAHNRVAQRQCMRSPGSLDGGKVDSPPSGGDSQQLDNVGLGGRDGAECDRNANILASTSSTCSVDVTVCRGVPACE